MLIVLGWGKVDREVARDLIKHLINEGHYHLSVRPIAILLHYEVDQVIGNEKVPWVLLFIYPRQDSTHIGTWVLQFVEENVTVQKEALIDLKDGIPCLEVVGGHMKYRGRGILEYLRDYIWALGEKLGDP